MLTAPPGVFGQAQAGRRRAAGPATHKHVSKGLGVSCSCPLSPRRAAHTQARNHQYLGQTLPSGKPGAAKRAVCQASSLESHPAEVLGPRGSVITIPVEQLVPPLNGAPVVVWFKNDLRIEDHPGLVAAAKACAAAGSPLLAVYVFDPSLLLPLLYTPAGPELLIHCVTALRASLRAAGGELVVRVGPLEGAMQELLGGCSAGAIVSHQEEEYRWIAPTQDLLAALQSSQPSLKLQYCHWTAPLWPPSRFTTNYREWAKARGPHSQPLLAPSSLPPPPKGIEPGDIPSVAQLRALLLAEAKAQAAAAEGADNAATAELWAVEAAVRREAEGAGLTTTSVYASGSGSTSGTSSSSSSSTSSGGGDPGLVTGSHVTLDLLSQTGVSATELLDAYLGSYSLSPSSPLATTLKEAVEVLQAPGVSGAPFTALFGQGLMSMGALSPRMVYSRAVEYERKRRGGVQLPGLLAALQGNPASSPAGAAAGAAAAAAEVAEFHSSLALLDDGRDIAPGVQIHFWRWRGGLTDYCVAEPSQPPAPGAPAILLVHGFGAFGDQWRDNMLALARAGYRVYAPTFPGFGRSQKAALRYSQDLWRDFLRDFVIQVVGRRAVVVGNSIGGFISASLAADFPGLVAGLVLVNSAGPVDPKFDIAEYNQRLMKPRTPPPAPVVAAISGGLFWYLERTIPGTLKWLYPTAPDRADEWLANEIYRAACDAGAVDVFKAVFYLPPPRALNYLAGPQGYGGPVHVLQGALDPLNDSKGRANAMVEACSNVSLELLDAGHCPFHELPEQFCNGLLRFVEQRVLPAERAKQGQRVVTAASSASLSSSSS